jgi:hypothetical protein
MSLSRANVFPVNNASLMIETENITKQTVAADVVSQDSSIPMCLLLFSKTICAIQKALITYLTMLLSLGSQRLWITHCRGHVHVTKSKRSYVSSDDADNLNERVIALSEVTCVRWVLWEPIWLHRDVKTRLTRSYVRAIGKLSKSEDTHIEIFDSTIPLDFTTKLSHCQYMIDESRYASKL